MGFEESSLSIFQIQFYTSVSEFELGKFGSVGKFLQISYGLTEGKLQSIVEFVEDKDIGRISLVRKFYENKDNGDVETKIWVDNCSLWM